MFLSNITLRNFRNYKSLHLHFSAGVNLIAGENAQGKTNILEGIYFLSTAKSHRTNRDDELIQHGKLWFYLKGQVRHKTQDTRQGEEASSLESRVLDKAAAPESDKGSHKGLSTVVEITNACGEKKRVKINGKSQERISSVIGKINVVMFSPEDLSLVKGAPSERRRFLDILISRYSPSYLYALQEYNLILKQRNELLKNIRDRKGASGQAGSPSQSPAYAGGAGALSHDSLDSWDALLVKTGSEVMRQRISIVSELAELAKGKHKQLTSDQEELCVEYQSQLDGLMGFEIDKVYGENLSSSVRLDIKRGSTSIGPHRDDLMFTIDGVDARKFCSQGQQRTCVLSLKLANLELLSRKLDEYPIVLLDDVMSELDENRASFLFDLLSRIPVQTLLTATSFDGFLKLPLCFSDYESFIVENGRVRGG